METLYEKNPYGGPILPVSLCSRITRTVKAGDVTWTPDGSGHGLSNEAGSEDLVFMALIINS